MRGGLLKRREVAAFLAGAIVAPPSLTRAQQPPLRVIGFLSSASAAPWRAYVAAFGRGLDELGYADGRNLAIEFRWAEGRYERLPSLAADLVRRGVAVLVATGGSVAVRAAMAATRSIPIVFTSGGDPIEHGLVTSLNRPGGNVTGVALITVDLFAKRLELLHEILPRAAKIGVLVNPAAPATSEYIRQVEAAARAMQRQIYVSTASNDGEIERAFEIFRQQRAAGLLISADAFFQARGIQFAALIKRYALPTMHAWREDVEAGGLMSYGPNLNDSYRQAGVYTGKILQGARPGSCPCCDLRGSNL